MIQLTWPDSDWIKTCHFNLMLLSQKENPVDMVRFCLDQNVLCQESCLLRVKHKNCLSAQDRIYWSNIDAVVTSHESAKIRKFEAGNVVKKYILCLILKLTKEELIVKSTKLLSFFVHNISQPVAFHFLQLPTYTSSLFMCSIHKSKMAANNNVLELVQVAPHNMLFLSCAGCCLRTGSQCNFCLASDCFPEQ